MRNAKNTRTPAPNARDAMAKAQRAVAAANGTATTEDKAAPRPTEPKTLSIPVLTPAVAAAPAPTAENTLAGIEMEITPAIAKEWLKTGIENRKINQRRVETYAKAMTENRWELHHQGVGFDPTGCLIDGQHRLLAVVKSGKTVRMMVTNNVPRNTFAVMDTMWGRNAGQAMEIHGVKHGKAAAAISRVLWFLFQNKWIDYATQLDNQILLGIYDANKEAIEWAMRYRKSRETDSIVPALAYAYARVSAKKRDKLMAFADKLMSGANLAPGSGPLLLKNWLGNKGKSNSTGARNEAIGKAFACIANWMEGKTSSQIRFHEDTIFAALTNALKD